MLILHLLRTSKESKISTNALVWFLHWAAPTCSLLHLIRDLPEGILIDWVEKYVEVTVVFLVKVVPAGTKCSGM